LEPLAVSNVLVEMDTPRFMAEIRTRALWWIPQMGYDILKVNEAVALTAQYRMAARTRRYPRECQLDVNEAERRLEHRLGVLILEGQEEGIFGSEHNSANKVSVKEYLGFKHTTTAAGLRVIGRLSQGELEELLVHAREQGDLSRMNVLRICRGEVKQSDRSAFNVRRRRIDSNKVIQSLADDLEAAASGLSELVVPEDIDVEVKRACKETIWQAITTITQEMSKW
jgi:hypothetical protein